MVTDILPAIVGPRFEVRYMNNKRNGTFSRYRGQLATAAVLLPLSSLAQDTMLEEILVTAEKRGAVSIMDSSFAISAISGASIEMQGLTRTSDILSQVPGVSPASANENITTIQIRGVSALVGDSTVGYYLDDLPYTQVGQTFVPELNPFDLARVEVLRGPQGTLYGASSQGGTVRIITNDPVMNEFSGKLDLGYSTTDGGGDSYQAQGALNIPIVDDLLAARVVASKVDREGFIDLPLTGEDDYNGFESETYRAKVLFTPTERLSIKGSWWRNTNEGGRMEATEDYEFFPVFAVFDPVTFAPVGVQPVTAAELESSTEFDLASLTVQYDFDAFSLYSSSSWIDASQDLQLNVYGVPLDLPLENESFSQELRLSSTTDSAVSWTVGAFYLDMEQDQGLNSGFVLDGIGAIISPASQTALISEQWALFGEVEYQFSHTLSVLIGARYFEDERSAEDLLPSITDPLDLFGIPSKRSENFSKSTARINISWTPADDALYYLNIAQGFRSGAANAGTSLLTGALSGIPIDPFADEEDLISYEVGGKITLAESGWAIEAAAYYLDWQDVITLLGVISPITNTPINFSENAGDVEGIGAEINLVYQGSEGLMLQFGGNVNQTEYQQDLPGAGIESGDQVAFAPEVTWSASASYSWDIGSSGLRGMAFFAAQHVDERADYALGFPTVSSESVTLAQARIGVQGQGWTLYLTGENLFDEDAGVTNLATNANAGIPMTRARPRTFGLNLQLGF